MGVLQRLDDVAARGRQRFHLGPVEVVRDGGVDEVETAHPHESELRLGPEEQEGAKGKSSGQARAEEECTKVWDEIQADLRAGGGPKSGPSIGPIGTYPGGSGPTNCDHFWQLQEAIGNS